MAAHCLFLYICLSCCFDIFLSYIYIFVCLSINIPLCLPICPVCLSACLLACLTVRLSFCLSISLPLCLPTYFACPPACLSVCPSICLTYLVCRRPNGFRHSSRCFAGWFCVEPPQSGVWTQLHSIQAAGAIVSASSGHQQHLPGSSVPEKKT